ncbi:MAG: hypothetical protein PF484_13140 [Bacteroidales bacterium]|jgi:hypothetical protein|nr:hypothetical protein [Bacteroidales bacterium]
MAKSNITIEWTEEERHDPVYTKFSIGLQEDIKTISNSLTYIRFLLNAISEIAETERGRKLMVNYSILSMMKQAFFYQAIIETHKLFNKKDVLNLPKLLNEMINGHKRIVWYSPLKKKDVEELKEDLLQAEIQEAFIKVKTIRDDYLAHNNRQPEDVNITLDDMEILQKKAEELSNKLGNALYGTSTAYDLQDENSLPGLFYQIEAFQKFREMISSARKDAIPNIETSILYDVLKGRK